MYTFVCFFTYTYTHIHIYIYIYTQDAIALVKQAKGSDMERRLFKMVHDWLLGVADDGRVKDYKYLFELYKATEEFSQMVDTAVLIAQVSRVFVCLCVCVFVL
jgi:hypothetical protein